MLLQRRPQPLRDKLGELRHDRFDRPAHDQADHRGERRIAEHLADRHFAGGDTFGFVEAGKGVVVLHHAIADYQDWEWWYKEVVGGKYLLKPEGSTPASTYLHDQELCIRPALDHPITARIGTMHFRDETYKGMWISPDVRVLLRTDNPTSDGPLAWISPYAKSRVVYIELGHGETAHLYPAYRDLVQDAIRWTAGRLSEERK